jgi:hypothetical protein
MSKIVAVLAVLMFALATTASASSPPQDFRSPDAQPATAQQDYRSPDTQRPIATRMTYRSEDLSSPDALPSGRFVPSTVTSTPNASGSFEWSYLAVGIATALIALGAVLITQRRRRHGLAIGS